MSIGYYFQQDVANVLSQPFHRSCPESELHLISPQEYFYVILRTGIWCGLLVATPLMASEIVATVTRQGNYWVIGLVLYLTFIVGAYIGFQSLDALLVTLCTPIAGEADMLVSSSDYFNLAQWRTFLYGLGMLVLAAGTVVWWSWNKHKQ